MTPTVFTCLSASPVTLEPTATEFSNRLWTGIAKANGEIVALGLLQQGTTFDWAKSSGRSSTISFDFSWGTYEEPTDIHIGCGFSGGGNIGRMRIPRPTAPRFRVMIDHCTTGRLEPMAVFKGEPNHVFWILFLARREVKFGRTRLWHLRSCLADQLEAPFGEILSNGRHGRFEHLR